MNKILTAIPKKIETSDAGDIVGILFMLGLMTCMIMAVAGAAFK